MLTNEELNPEIRERAAVALYRLTAERNGRPPQWETHGEHFQNEWRTRADSFLTDIGVTAEITAATVESFSGRCDLDAIESRPVEFWRTESDDDSLYPRVALTWGERAALVAELERERTQNRELRTGLRDLLDAARISVDMDEKPRASRTFVLRGEALLERTALGACPHFQADPEEPGACYQCGNPAQCEYRQADDRLARAALSTQEESK